MKNIKFLIAGTLFGIIMFKSEAASWYRIQEMFRFQAFHMYGIIGLAVALGVPMVAIIKAKKIKDYAVDRSCHTQAWFPHLIGGTIFGLGWALSGACPGPIVVNIGGYFGYVQYFLSPLRDIPLRRHSR